MKLRVAACQILTYPEVDRSAEKVIRWIKQAAAEKVDVVSFPEACLCGYQNDPSYWEKADPADFQRAEEAIIAVLKGLDIAVVLGTAHWEDGSLYNSLLIVDKGGEVRGRYSKTHLAERWPQPGKLLPVYDLAGVQSCFIICHDVRYPELVRLPVMAGARVCYFCSNEAGLTKEFKLSAYRAMPTARATENSVFLVMANAPADADRIDSASQSHGNSKIIRPDGNILLEASYFEEGLVKATIDLTEADGCYARRSATDETILKDWMRKGLDYVTLKAPGPSGAEREGLEHPVSGMWKG